MSSKARSRRSAKLILLTRGWHTARMPTGRHLGHRAPNDADKERTARAVARAADLAPIIAELRARGVTTLNGIAAALNERAAFRRQRGAVIGTRHKSRGC
jgi:hypothetical protein